jgi:opacity protein-like surface antigen
MYLQVLAAAVAAVVASSTRAQGQTPARLGIAAGATAPVSVYASDKRAGYHFGLLFDIPVPRTPLEFRIDGAFHEMRYSGNSTRDQILMASGNVVLAVPTGSFVAPYVLGGIGFYNSQRFLVASTDRSTTRGWSAGGGVRFELTDATMFVEARYHRTSGDAGIRILPVSLGVFF